MTYSKEMFLQNLATVTINGFKQKKGVQAIVWIRQLPFRTEKIVLGYRLSGEGFVIDGIGVGINFKEVEDTIADLIKGSRFLMSAGEIGTIGKSLFDVPQVSYGRLKSDISSEIEFYEVRDEIEKVVNFGALPFLNLYSDIKNVADLYSSLEPEQVVKYIQGSILFLKSILVLKLASHNDYLKKRDQYRQKLYEATLKNKDYRELLEAYDSLFC